MRPKPDNRNDNADNIKYNIKMTKENIKRANDMIDVTPDQKMKQTLEDKNKRREDSIGSMRGELKDELEYQKNKYE